MVNTRSMRKKCMDEFDSEPVEELKEFIEETRVPPVPLPEVIEIEEEREKSS